MAPNIRIMRQEVSDLYSGPQWKRRVSLMPDAQIIAIYFRTTTEREAKAKQKESKQDGDQQTLF